jgi:hypothetical protein
MDKKPISKTKAFNSKSLGLLLLAIGCAVLLRRDSHSSQNDTFSSASKDA